MQITLVLTAHFRQMLGVEQAGVTLQARATVADVVTAFLDAHPDYRRTLEDRKGFLFGELKAIYSVDGQAVSLDRTLTDGDELKVLKAFIGG